MQTLTLLLLALTAFSCARPVYRLVRAEDKSWLQPPKGPRAAPEAAHEAEYGPYVRQGYVDIRPGMALKVVSPVVKDGGALQTEIIRGEGSTIEVKSNITGVAVSYYRAEPATGGGIEMRFVKGEGSTSETAKLPIRADVRWLRLFFQTRRSADDRDITLLGATGKAALDAVNQVADRCDQPGIACLAAPYGTAISPYIEVRRDGTAILVPLGTRIRQLWPGRRPQPDQLQVSRLWRSKLVEVAFDKSRNDVLDFLLNAGDEVTLSPQ